MYPQLHDPSCPYPPHALQGASDHSEQKIGKKARSILLRQKFGILVYHHKNF